MSYAYTALGSTPASASASASASVSSLPTSATRSRPPADIKTKIPSSPLSAFRENQADNPRSSISQDRHAIPEEASPPADGDNFDPSSSTVPPPTEPPPSPLTEPGAWFSYPLSYAANSIYRRVSAPPDPRLTGLLQTPGASKPRLPSPGPGIMAPSMIFSRSRSRQRQQQQQQQQAPPLPSQGSGVLVQPPARQASPFQPPPLAALELRGFKATTPDKDRILSRALAEEIRLLVPPRLQLEAEWRLCYSVEQDGASLSTLYHKCDGLSDGRSRSGFVVVVRDSGGGVFGAFLTDAPRPGSSYYGTGECFLWCATIQTVDQMLAHLPPPPSEDTTHMESRSTTIMSPTKAGFGDVDLLTGPDDGGISGNNNSGGSSHLKPDDAAAATTGTRKAPIDAEERIRFRAFPYSGINDYMIYCEHGYMSVGGGDGKYGLWLNDSLEEGVSSPSLTFGNEMLSEEGEKFDVLGVEVWFVGA